MEKQDGKKSEENVKVIQKISSNDIRNRIYTIRGMQVMLDSDLAELYGYDVRTLNQQVRRNIARFPIDFMFELTREEVEAVKSQIVTSRNFNLYVGQEGGRRKLPLVFTEQGIYMLATVLHGELAEQQSIFIMRAFRVMRHYLNENALVFNRLDRVELKQIETDRKITQIFQQLQNPKETKAVLFFKGQMWDATSLIEDIISKATKSIILIDGYVDKKNLDLFSKKRKNVTIELYTSKNGNKLTQKEITDFNNQYGGLTIKYTDEFHDRFLILDKTELYHIGASIKDAGTKAFELSIIEDDKHLQEILKRLN